MRSAQYGIRHAQRDFRNGVLYSARLIRQSLTMKDPRDFRTADLLGEPPRRPGRPRLHADAAARQKAYRQRLKERGLREVRRIVLDDRALELPLAAEDHGQPDAIKHC